MAKLTVSETDHTDICEGCHNRIKDGDVVEFDRMHEMYHERCTPWDSVDEIIAKYSGGDRYS